MTNKEMFERKQRYADNLHYENSKVDTLTKEQHDVLSELCSNRHKIHCMDAINIMNTSCSDYDDFYEFLYNVNAKLTNVDLPEIEYITELDVDFIPCDIDYYELLSDDEKEKWEQKAEQFNETKPKGSFYHSGYTLWIEDSGVFDEVDEIKENINSVIEEYLRKIDEKHGTKYCPTGHNRLFV